MAAVDFVEAVEAVGVEEVVVPVGVSKVAKLSSLNLIDMKVCLLQEERKMLLLL